MSKIIKANGILRRAIAGNAREFTEALLKVWREECRRDKDGDRSPFACGDCFIMTLCGPDKATDEDITRVAATLAERTLKAWLPPEGKGGVPT